MASKETSRETSPAEGQKAANPVAREDSPSGKPARGGPPDWSHGLRQLYDSVVEEELPDSFKDLLDKLDETDTGETENEKDRHPPRKSGGA